MNHSAPGVLLLAALLFGQPNVWTELPQNDSTRAGGRNWSSLVYSPDSNRFLSTLGWLAPPSRYSELSLRFPDTRWINFLPHDSLYGEWGDSTGNAYGAGMNFDRPFGFKTVEGYLRPALYYSTFKTFYQSAYNSDDQCIYYYIANMTIRYDTRTRHWDTLSTTSQPATHWGGDAPLIWGSLCYDPSNREILLFGGGDIDGPGSHCGTWVYDVAANTWRKLDLTLEPPARCQSQMVYDAKNRCIILFGGDRLDYLFADTWVYDCVTRTWSEKKPALAPAPRAGHALLYLPKSQTVVLLGGYFYKPELKNDITYYTGYEWRDTLDLWRYSVTLNEWKLIKRYTPPMVKPGWLFQSLAAADTADRIVVLGDSGNTKNTYVMTCDPAETDEPGTLAYGRAAGAEGHRTGPSQPVWFQENVGPSNPDSLSQVYRTLPLNTWVRMAPPKEPYNGRAWSTRVLDFEHDLYMVWAGGHSAYSGTDIPHYSLSENRWSIGYEPEFMIDLNRTGGTSGNYANFFSFNGRPFIPCHTYHMYCYSPIHHRMVYHMPAKYTVMYDPVRMDWDTTRILNSPLDHSTWASVGLFSTSHGVFGWLADDLFFLDTTNVWKLLPAEKDTTVPAYYCDASGAVYDPKRDRMIMSTGDVTQLFSYNFKDSTFVRLNPSGSASGAIDLRAREAVYLPAQDKILYSGNGVHLVYDCAGNSWETLAVTRGANVGETSSWSSGYGYDPKRDLVWDVDDFMAIYVMRVAGGYDPDSLLSNVHKATGPARKTMLAAWPNPFNPAITIKYAIPSGEGRGVLTVFDSRGRIVRHFDVQGEANAVWNGRDERGAALGSGIYLIRLTTGATVQRHRVTLAR